MSNAKIRRHLETMSAPVIAWLVDNGYVQDDCGILNARYNIREGVLVASRAVQNMTPVHWDRPVANAIAKGLARRVRERL